ncbi:MAG TPA: hypothetical protein VLK65_01205 [Vicinamibacteria bacterium]|nr:hypothetical protein [Vicinamibacteria bacterium]
MGMGVMVLALTAQLTGFSGVWERDPERSDDADEKMRLAFERMRTERERGGRPGELPPGGVAPGETGRRDGPEGRRGGPMEVDSGDELVVEFDGAELRVDRGQRLQIYYLDGQKHKREMPNGTELETTAELRGNSVWIREKMSRGEMLWTYELAPDGQTLVVTSTFELKGLKEPVVIRSVYERLPE